MYASINIIIVDTFLLKKTLLQGLEKKCQWASSFLRLFKVNNDY